LEGLEIIDAVGVREDGVQTEWGESARVGVSTVSEGAVSGRGANRIRRVGVGTLVVR